MNYCPKCESRLVPSTMRKEKDGRIYCVKDNTDVTEVLTPVVERYEHEKGVIRSGVPAKSYKIDKELMP